MPVLAPMQGSLLHFLRRSRFPSPQVFEHALQADHVSQSLSFVLLQNICHEIHTMYSIIFNIYNAQINMLIYDQMRRAYDLTSLSEKTRKSHHLQMLL